MNSDKILEKDLTVQKNILKQMKELNFSSDIIENQITVIGNIEKQIATIAENKAD